MKTIERPKERRIETQWEIAAPVADVWRALTDAEWLTNWFPTEAKVTPGKGGTVWTAWSAGNEQFSASIAEWDENRRLKLVYADPTSDDEAEAALREGRFFPFQIAADFHLRASSGGVGTVLRLVHSGFAEDSGWDWQYEATARGWKFELGGLKHYLERHKGVPRFVVQARHAIGEVAFDAAWQMLLGVNGLAAPPAPPAIALQPGGRYEFKVPGDGVLRGTVEISNPPHDFAGTVENLNDARLRLKVDRSCAEEGVNDAVFFLSTYGVDETTRAELQAGVEAMMKRLFGA